MSNRHKILLIEPDLLLATIYKEHLNAHKYNVRVVGGVQKAIYEIDKLRPDLVILELQLSTHNGYEFLYELRSYSEWQNIPVLVHSMVPLDDLNLDTNVSSELGIIGYLYKPNTSLSKLLYEINNYFQLALDETNRN